MDMDTDMAWSPERSIRFRGVSGGMNDTLYATEIAPNQASLIRNMHFGKEKVVVWRGGSLRQSNTALANKPLLLHQLVKHNSDGTITRTMLVATSAGLFQFNATTVVFNQIAGTGTPSGNKPSMVNFVNGSGSEAVIYCDGTLFFMWDGTTVTNLLTGWTAAGFTNAPRYLAVYADALWAAGDTANPSTVGFSDDLNPRSFGATAIFVVGAGDGTQIRGLRPFYSHLAIAKDHSIYLIIGKDISEFELKRVSSNRGAYSHWGIQALGHLLLFNDDAGFYVGSLREAVEDGMVVEEIGANMSTRYSLTKAGTAYNVDSAYVPNLGEIFWSTRSDDADDFNEIYTFSTYHSKFNVAAPLEGPDPRFIWGGVWTGLSCTALSAIENSNGKPTLYCGTSTGYVMLLNDGHKDNRAVGATAGTDIVYEVHPAEMFLVSSAVSARVRRVFPVFYSKYNEAVNFECIVDQSERLPITSGGDADPVIIKFTGSVPLWTDGTDPDVTSQWGSRLWIDRPFLRAGITVNVMASSFQPIFRCPGTNAQDELAFAGWSGTYQVKKARVRG